MSKYSYEIDGTDGEGQDWSKKGEVTASGLSYALELIMRESIHYAQNRGAYQQCQGPYNIHKLVVEKGK